jgi:hypothetical protein
MSREGRPSPQSPGRSQSLPDNSFKATLLRSAAEFRRYAQVERNVVAYDQDKIYDAVLALTYLTWHDGARV